MITNEILNELLKEEIQKAKDLGLNINEKINPIIKIDKSTTHFGCCKYEKIGDYEKRIYISKYFLNAPKEEIRTVIMHEILHTIKGSRGHDIIWQNAAKLVSQSYNYVAGEYHLNPHPYSKERNSFEHTNLEIDNFKYLFKCPKCGFIIGKNRMCQMVKTPSRYFHNQCGSNYRLERIK